MLIVASTTIDYASALLPPLPGLNPDERRFDLDTLVQHRLTQGESLEDVARVLFWLLYGGYSVGPHGGLLETRVRLDAINGRLTIEIRTREHAPPHFHVTAGDSSASFAIADCSLLHGSINGDRALVETWHRGARDLLVRVWNQTRPSDCPVGPIVRD